MDSVDRNILRALSDNSRLSFKQLGEIVHTSDVTAKARVARLVDSGVIADFTTTVDKSKLGLSLEVTIGVTADPGMVDEVIERLSTFDEYYLIWKTSGAHSMNLRGAFRDHVHMNEVLNKSLGVYGVREYHLSILDRVAKSKQFIP
ncbi:MAG: Lrp/AsnC family transcriptional regulator [Chloroflexi bacterium]|nr:Lrp/AsnC family transcriptional regulator [Chloroflexota bacterium]